MKIFRLGACLKCRGDLVYDEGDWLCLQCGVYYYTRLYQDSGHRNVGVLRVGRIVPDPECGSRAVPLWPAA